VELTFVHVQATPPRNRCLSRQGTVACPAEAVCCPAPQGVECLYSATNVGHTSTGYQGRACITTTVHDEARGRFAYNGPLTPGELSNSHVVRQEHIKQLLTRLRKI